MPKTIIPFDCIIPAAGLSTRMGDWKLARSEESGKTLLEETLEAVFGVCERIIVVGGYRFNDLKTMLKGREDILLLENREFEKGMLSSIQKGLEAVSRHFFILPADMPGIGEVHFRTLFASFTGECIVRPVYGGNPGHPVLFPLSCKRKILELGRGRLIDGMKNWECREIPWEDSSVVTDIDTPGDYLTWKEGKVSGN